MESLNLMRHAEHDEKWLFKKNAEHFSAVVLEVVNIQQLPSSAFKTNSECKKNLLNNEFKPLLYL